MIECVHTERGLKFKNEIPNANPNAKDILVFTFYPSTPNSQFYLFFLIAILSVHLREL